MRGLGLRVTGAMLATLLLSADSSKGGGEGAFHGGSGRDDRDDVSDATSVVSREITEENVP